MLVFISLITVLFIGCSNDKTEINKKSLYDSFFVQLTLENLSDLIAAKETLTQAIGDTIFTIDDNHLLIGMFDSFRAASDRGFELHADNLIDEFEIFHNDSILNHDYYDLFFVGNDLGRPALYRTSLMEVKPNLIWSKWGREIIKLSPAKSRDNYFFTTCLTKGIRGSFPYIWDARLYNFDSKGEDIQLVQEFGRGLTLHSNWESDSTFTTYFTILDSLITSTVIQKIYSYSYAGDRIDTTEQIYELVSDGIPFPKIGRAHV